MACASVRGLDFERPLHELSGRDVQDRAPELHDQGTYQLSQNNKPLIAYYQPSSKVQPTRLDRQLLRTDGGHSPGDRRQLPSGLLAAAGRGREWNSILNSSTFLPKSAPAFGYDWKGLRRLAPRELRDLRHEHRGGPCARPGDTRSSAIRFSARSLALKNGWLGSHSFKAGGEWFRETQTASRFAGSLPTTCYEILRSGVPS